MKNLRNTWGVLIALMLIVSLSGAQILADSIQDLNNQADEIESQNQQLEASKEEVEAYIAEIDNKISAASAQLNETNTKLDDTRVKIDKTEKELKEAQESIDIQYDDMKLRIQFMYENGDTQMLDLLLGSEDFSEFINKAEYISELSQYDRDMLEKLKHTRKKIADSKKVLETEEKNLVALQTEQENRKAQLVSLSSEKEAELAGYNDQIAENEEKLAKIENEVKAMEAKIAAAKKAQEQQQQKPNTPAPKPSGNGYYWPVPGYNNVSSDFGYRTDPIHGGSQFHTGIDIPAPTGTPVVAAQSGVVAWACYSSSAGNWVGITHSDGATSVYMHLSGFAVSEGQSVSAGQTIGYIGSTGWSTGPHLDFSVRVNGSAVSPWNYL